MLCERPVQHSDVGVALKDLRMFTDQLEVEKRKKLVRVIAADRAGLMLIPGGDTLINGSAGSHPQALFDGDRVRTTKAAGMITMPAWCPRRKLTSKETAAARPQTA